MTNTKSNMAAARAGKNAGAMAKSAGSDKQPSCLDQMQQLLIRKDGASIAELVESTGWQPHSVRGALAGALKKRGLVITSEKMDGTRRYRTSQAA